MSPFFVFLYGATYSAAGAGAIGAATGAMGLAGAAVSSILFFNEVEGSMAFSVLLKPTAAIHNTTKIAANVQVAFSTKSVVLRTPITWLGDEKPDAKPPPFDFCEITNKINKMPTITANDTNTLNILLGICLNYFI